MAFGSKQESSQKASSTSFLGKGTYIDGKFQVEGNVRMDGNFKGEINGNADLIIGEGAYVEANVSVRNLTVMGELHGSVQCAEKLEIHNTGKVAGEIKAGKLIIEENAIFEGTSSMSKKEEKKPAQPAEQAKSTPKSSEAKK